MPVTLVPMKTREPGKCYKTIGVNSLEELVDRTVPPAIRMQHELDFPPAMSEHDYLEHIKEVSLKNKIFKTYIGQGYYDTLTPRCHPPECF